MPAGAVANRTVYGASAFVAGGGSITVSTRGATTSPGVSSSVPVIVTVTAANEVGDDVASPVLLTVCDTTVAILLLASAASATLTVTVCLVFHVVALYVSPVGAALPLVRATRTVTDPLGSIANAVLWLKTIAAV